MSLLLPESGLLLWMLLAFGVVFGILARYGFPVITQMVAKRKEYIDQSLQAAKAANEQLQRLQTEGDAILAKAREEQARILKDAKETSKRMVNDAREKAQVEGNRMLREVQAQIKEEKDEAIRDIRRQVAVLSVNIAEKVVRERLDTDEEQMTMIARLLDELNDKPCQ